jgi:hypothetical protein
MLPNTCCTYGCVLCFRGEPGSHATWRLRNVGARLGSMGIATALCHVASSKIHAPQVTRALVRVEHGLQQWLS